MKKFLKILNYAFILIAIFSIFGLLKGENFALAAPIPVVQNTSKVNNSETGVVPEKITYNPIIKEKIGFKYGLFKFFTAMFGVLISALAIFFGLKLYKKFVLKNNLKADNINYDTTLESPKDFKEAINLFLDKTDKE